jgi:hypothetical protein
VDKHKWLDRAEIEFHPSMFGLPPGKPLIANPKTSELLIDCEGQYVLWNNVSDEAARIDQPKEYADILQALDDPDKLRVTALLVVDP